LNSRNRYGEAVLKNQTDYVAWLTALDTNRHRAAKMPQMLGCNENVTRQARQNEVAKCFGKSCAQLRKDRAWPATCCEKTRKKSFFDKAEQKTFSS
jgi:hypothetical protein